MDSQDVRRPQHRNRQAASSHCPHRLLRPCPADRKHGSARAASSIGKVRSRLVDHVASAERVRGDRRHVEESLGAWPQGRLDQHTSAVHVDAKRLLRCPSDDSRAVHDHRRALGGVVQLRLLRHVRHDRVHASAVAGPPIHSPHPHALAQQAPADPAADKPVAPVTSASFPGSASISSTPAPRGGACVPTPQCGSPSTICALWLRIRSTSFSGSPHSRT